MKQPSNEKVEQYRREFSKLLKDLMAQAIVRCWELNGQDDIVPTNNSF